jgi:1-acyl-sn-glycerol-3-phosphate acyltransferase
MRAKIHKFITTEALTIENTKMLNNAARQLILNQLLAFDKNQKATLGTE